jgi:hypothetical protein
MEEVEGYNSQNCVCSLCVCLQLIFASVGPIRPIGYVFVFYYQLEKRWTQSSQWARPDSWHGPIVSQQ